MTDQIGKRPYLFAPDILCARVRRLSRAPGRRGRVDTVAPQPGWTPSQHGPRGSMSRVAGGGHRRAPARVDTVAPWQQELPVRQANNELVWFGHRARALFPNPLPISTVVLAPLERPLIRVRSSLALTSMAPHTGDKQSERPSYTTDKLV